MPRMVSVADLFAPPLRSLHPTHGLADRDLDHWALSTSNVQSHHAATHRYHRLHPNRRDRDDHRLAIGGRLLAGVDVNPGRHGFFRSETFGRVGRALLAGEAWSGRSVRKQP